MSTNLNTRKVAIVSGGAGAIGSAIARRLAADGHHVVVAYSTSAEAAARLVQEFTALGQAASAIQVDITKPGEVSSLFSSVIDREGRVDYLVNNAGTMARHRIDELTDDLFLQHFLANVQGPFNMLRAASLGLADNGRIVNISSTLVQAPMAGVAAYTASRAAVESLGQVAAKELGGRGITVNSLAVGPTVPGMFSKSPPERQAAMAAASPFNRLGTPQDVADVVSFLLSGGARWITGQTITVDGGST